MVRTAIAFHAVMTAEFARSGTAAACAEGVTTSEPKASATVVTTGPNILRIDRDSVLRVVMSR